MSHPTEVAFQAVSDAAQTAATAVPCSIEEYIEGLRGIISDLETLVEAAEQDLRA